MPPLGGAKGGTSVDYIVPERSSLQTRPWIVVLALAAILVIATSLFLLHLRKDAVESQTRELRLLSLALTAEVGRGLQGAEEGFNAMRLELRDGRLPSSGTGAAKALQTHAELMPLVQTLWLVDDAGRLMASSDSTPMPELLSFAPSLASLNDNTTAISRPFSGDAPHGPLVAMAVRFTAAPGSSGGWIFAAMPAESLLGAFSVASPSPDARMAVFRNDGVRLAGEIVAAPTFDEASIAQRLASMQNADVHRFRDGSDRLVALHRLSRYGLDVVLTRELGVMLVGWREAVRLSTISVLLLLFAFGTSAYLVVRADKRRAAAQKALRAQQSRTTKFNSLGALAGAVAHDFNNVLAAIVGYGEMAQDSAPPDSAQRRHIDMVVMAAMRGKALVERILTFSGGGARASTVFEIEPIVEEVLTMLAGSLPPGIILESQLRAERARLSGDPTQTFEAIMNLCMNGMQAMPQGGKLTVQLKREHIFEQTVLSHSQLDAGDFLVLSVSDQGTGITPAVMEHLFEPFFTTHSARTGTGLGLAVVHGVVTEFGGAVDVQSSHSGGSTFTLYFPESEDEIEATAGRKSSPRGAGQTLMVVDDDPELVSMVEKMVRGLGYSALGYTDSIAALQALLSGAIPFAAVITDEVMPGLSGTKLTEALRQNAFEIPVLLLSGYGGPLLAARAAASGVTQVLIKPIGRADLARALSELLG